VPISLKTRRFSTLARTARRTSLVVIEPQSTVPNLRSQNSVLLAEIINDLLLFVIHPTSNGNEQQAERIKGAWHLGSLPPSSARSP